MERLLQAILILSLPIVLILGSVRLVATEQWLRLEYNRPGFPEDTFGFTKEDRLKYGPYGVRYILSNHDISYLGDLRIDDKPAFDERELEHMQDVQGVAVIAFRILFIIMACFVGSAVVLARNPSSRPQLRQALRLGGFTTLAVVIIALILIAASWSFFFESFHAVFFDEGTWQFSRSDTLIRLYPEQFWIDAALSIAILTALGTALSIGLPWWWERHHLTTETTQ